MRPTKLSIRALLLAGIGLSSCLFAIALGFALDEMSSISGQFQTFIEQDQQRLETLRTMQAEGSQAVIAVAKKIMVSDLEPPLRVATRAAEEFDLALSSARTLYAADAQNAASVEKIAVIWARTRPQSLQAIEMVDAGQVEDARRLFVEEIQKSWGQIRKQIQPLIGQEGERIEVTRAAVLSEVRVALLIGLVLGGTALVLGLSMNLFASHKVTANMCHVADKLEQIAEGDGDLTRRLDEDGAKELARLASGFNKFTHKTQQLIREVADSTLEMTAIATEVSQVATTARTTADQQHESMEQVAAAMTEMTATVQNVAQSAETAAVAAKDSDHQAKSGRDVVKQTRQTIENLAQNVENAVQNMTDLEQETDNVSTVLAVIKDIADQTNLLALNAAIEAARAGENGRGFAVVADEVRTLAARTRKSTEEINTMITRLQSGAKSTAAMMEASRESARETSEQAMLAGEALDAITAAVGSIRDMNIEIASSAEEQGAVSEEIMRNTIGINELGKQNLQTAVKMDESAQRLNAVSGRVTSLVQKFKT